MTDFFTNNPLKSRFEYHVNGKLAFADYRREKDTIFIDHVESADELRGTGAAGKLMQHIVEVAEREHLDIVPICGYAASWISKHKNRS